ncbi:hypothetical protein EV702DRAFT_635755 [Suillus placidus]|uniref:Uncharacterized protein n=1 Tax=Suillus placidus TaxID=48579 RepID=A0A9P6ZMH1_9AGAM|nr:hypothetical protein EV702DRAFT_635755 [Suillus placidus]
MEQRLLWVEPSCNLSLQDWTARTVLHITLDKRLEDVVAYLLEQNAGLSATATLLPDMWSWATNKTWFPKVLAAALVVDQPCTRIKGKVVEAVEKSQIVLQSLPTATTLIRFVLLLFQRYSMARCQATITSRSTFHIVISHFKRTSKTPRKMIPADSSSTFTGKVGSMSLVTCSTDYHQGGNVTRVLQQITTRLVPPFFSRCPSIS